MCDIERKNLDAAREGDNKIKVNVMKTGEDSASFLSFCIVSKSIISVARALLTRDNLIDLHFVNGNCRSLSGNTIEPVYLKR